MPGLSAKFNADTPRQTDVLDIRTRLLVSLCVTTAIIYLSDTLSLALMGVITGIYLAQTRRWKIIGIAYLFVALMCLLSFGIIWGLFTLCEWATAGTGWERTVAMFKPGMLGNFHTPFLRMIPSVNVILALTLNFSVQGFTGTMKSLRLPRTLFIPLMVFCRFVPEFIETIGRLRDAVRMRGFSVSFGSAFVHPLVTLRLTFVPLAVKTLRMADNLAIAAEMKGVGLRKNPTKLNALIFRKRDFAVIAAAAAVSAALSLLNAVRVAEVPPAGPGMMRSQSPETAAESEENHAEVR